MTTCKKPPTPAPVVWKDSTPAASGLRDQIAIRALEMLVGADPRQFLEQMCAPDPAPATSLANVARLSYAIADAMLVARNG